MSLLRSRWRKVLESLRNDKGFTLMELMIVVVIIAILASGGFVAYEGFIRRAVDGLAANLAGSLGTVVQAWELQNGKSLAYEGSKTSDIKTELQDYVQAQSFTVIAYASEPTPPDKANDGAVQVMCPNPGATSETDKKTWTVWVVRNGRVGKATFVGLEAAQANSCQ